MSLPDSWVERLFGRLSVRYGSAFLRQYEGIQTDAVKADWAMALVDFQRHPKAIEWALANLPEYAPNAGQFVRLCHSAPGEDRKPVPALSAPKADPHKFRAILEAVGQALAKPKTKADTAANLRAIEASGKALTLAQRQALRELEQDGPAPAEFNGLHQPIPAENCPWNRAA